MSLLGRLEDLSLPDIVQIVYLSRRTGMLEIVDGDDRWGIFFVNGLIANAFGPNDGSLLEFLDQRKVVDPEEVETLRRAEEGGEIVGDLIVSREILSPEDLAELIRLRITTIVRPLLTRRSGEFNFLLSDSIGSSQLGYDLESLFKQGGVLPSEILDEGDKAKPLQNLEETMRAGKALLRGEKGSEVAAFGFGEEIEQMTALSKTPSSDSPDDEFEDRYDDDFDEEADEVEEGLADELESPFGEADEGDMPFAEVDLEPDPIDVSAKSRDERGEEPGSLDEGSPFGTWESDEASADLSTLLSSGTEPEWSEDLKEKGEEKELLVDEHHATEPVPPPVPPRIPPASPRESTDERVGSLAEPPQARPRSKFTVEGQSDLDAEDRNVVLYERNPMLRVAAKRAFGQSEFRIFQFGQLHEVQRVASEMLESNRFFVSFLELDQERDDDTELLLHQIKRTNRHLPVVVIDKEASLERRHRMLKLGADMYLTKPSPAHLRPAIADQSLRLFADELVQFAEHAVQSWESLTQTYGEGDGAVGATLYQIAEKERLNRTRNLMRSLINELADPDDINQLAQTVLRLANEYLDRAALFAASPTRFIGLGGFGPTGSDSDMSHHVRRIRIARDEDSVLRDVTLNQTGHRGKLRRTRANVRLLQGLGSGAIPTLATALIAGRFDGADRGRALGVIIAAVGGGQALGPLLGGVLLEFGGWRPAVSI
ncbi:MAG: MFS transporter, partial [Acidobacteria bacterium]|nr:MFS transporter [Acidobacteriota bacterium]